MSKILAAAKVSKENTADFLKALSIIILKGRNKKVKPLLPTLKSADAGARAFVKGFGLDTEAYNTMRSNVLKSFGEVRRLAKVFSTSLREGMRAKIKNDVSSVTGDQLDVLNAISTLLNTPDSEGAYSRLSLYITKLGNRDLNNYFIKTEKESGGSFSQIMKQIEAAAKKLGGKSAFLTMDEKNKVKDKTKLAAYTKLRKALAERIKHDVRTVVSNSGKPFLLMPEFVTAMKNLGYPIEALNDRYSSVLTKSKLIGIAEDGVLTDKYGSRLNSSGVGSGMTVRVNPDYDKTISKENRSAWVFSYQGDGPAPNRAYTLEMLAFRKGGTVEKLASIDADEVEKWKKKWRASPDKHLASLAEVLYWTCGRYGTGIGSAGGERTYGISWLSGKDGAKAKVLNLAGNKVKLVYPGKKGVIQTHIIEPSDAKTAVDKKALLGLIAEIRKARSQQKEFIFGDKKGKRILSTEFNNWFRKITGVTAHKIRHIRGTELATSALAEATAALAKKKNKTAKDVNTAFMDAMKIVGLKLGHVSKDKVTPNTAIKNYVLPHVMNDWYKAQGQRPAKTVEKAIAAAERALK